MDEEKRVEGDSEGDEGDCGGNFDDDANCEEGVVGV